MKLHYLLIIAGVIIFLSPFNPLRAQTEKKQFLIGGQYGLDFSSNKTTFNGSDNSYEQGKSRILGITPQVGYFFLRNTAAGLEVRYLYQKEFGQDYQDYDNYMYERSFAVTPFLRHYFGQGKIKPYLHTSIGPGWRKTGYKIYNFTEYNQDSKILFFQMKGGVAFFINDHISFDFGFGYESTKTYYKESLTDGSSDKWNTVAKGIKTSAGVVAFL